MSRWRPIWRVLPSFRGWRVEASVWRRPSARLPDGYHVSVTAPGGPFGFDEAHALAAELTRRRSRSGRAPTAARIAT